MEPHPSYKKGFGATALIMAFVACLQIPEYLAITSMYGICVAKYKDLNSLTQKLYKLSLNKDQGLYTDHWNEILFKVPTTTIGLFLPVFLTGLFNYWATTRLNATLKAVTENSNSPSEKGKRKNESNANRTLLQRQKENRKVAKLMLCITAFTSVVFLPLWISCWIFPAAPGFVFKYNKQYLQSQTFFQYLSLLHSLAAPLFYAGMHKNVRHMLKKHCQRRRSSNGT